MTGTALVIRDTTITAALEASGIAEPMASATLSTKVMGTVLAVLVREGDRVTAGQPLVRIDARDLMAKSDQVGAAIASAQAARHEAELAAGRMRALFADSAAPRAQLDAAEAGLARAEAGVRAAQAGQAELAAIADYAVVRAPFAGTVTQRLADPGAFAAPGTPLVTVQDQRQLRVVVTTTPAAASVLKRGAAVPVRIEGTLASARVEAVVPAASPGLYTINAIVDNRGLTYATGGAATVLIPQGARSAVLVPNHAVRREGDLTGVDVVRGGQVSTRWIRLGHEHNEMVEVLAGLRAGDTIQVRGPSARGA
jgi:RND family efflux transporter MFP subunit